MRSAVAWILLFAGFAGSARSSWTAPLSRSAGMSLFEKLPAAPSGAARHTFVIWVNGDSEHFVPAVSDEPGTLRRADAVEVERLDVLASRCEQCNAVLLHDQRGSDRWYTARGPWGVALRAYSRGHRLMARSTSEVNGADPELLAGLLRAAATLFPGTNIHFIYRGHSFLPDYVPGSPDILPFDVSAPKSAYGLREFTKSFALAGQSRLASVTLAACSMAYWEVAAALAPYVDVLLASQVDVLETLSTGFDFGFLSQVRDEQDVDSVTTLMASTLMNAFERAPSDEAMMEFPLTRFDLRLIAQVASSWDALREGLLKVQADFFTHYGTQISVDASVVKRLSSRYVASLQARGKTNAEIASLGKFVKVPALNPRQRDFGKFLEALETHPERYGIRWEDPVLESVRNLSAALKESTRLYNVSPISLKSGLNFQLP